FGDDGADLALDILGEDGPQAPAGAVGRDLRRPQPGAVGIAEEVVARLHREVAGGEVDAEAAILRLAGGGGAGRLGRGREDGRGGGEQERGGEKEFTVWHETDFRRRGQLIATVPMKEWGR